MIRNYLKVALRYLGRYKEYTAINTLGLSVGITCCLLIMLFVRNEYSYDAFHRKSDRLFRVWQHEKYEDQDFVNVVTPLPMAGALQSNYPEIESTCRIYDFNPMVKNGDRSFSENVNMVDSTFLELFDFQLLRGNREQPFPTANSALLTPELARKYFGTDDPVGKSFSIQLGDDQVPFTVAGIIKASPEASSIKFGLVIPFSNAVHLFSQRNFHNWFNVFLETYVLLKPGVDYEALQKRFPVMMKQQLGEDYREGGFMVYLQPIEDIHLNTELPAGNQPTSNPKYSYILSSIGLLVLILACINFITLNIGRSSTRALEVGVRKVMGAGRRQLIRQFWGEAFLLTLAAVIIGLLLTAVCLPSFNQLVNQHLTLSFDAGFLLFAFVMMALVALVAGIYPAIILSGFKPVEVLKGKLALKSGTGWFRQALVVGQFTASVAMIICTLVISRQLHYIMDKDLGYNKDQVVIVSTNMSRQKGMDLAERFRMEAIKRPEIAAAGVSIFSMAQNSWAELGFTDEKKVYHAFQYNSVDTSFMTAMGFSMASGRAFSADHPADMHSSAIVNEAFVKEFGLTDPVGKKLPGPFDQQIVGVVKDFNYQSLHTAVRPLLLTISPDSVIRRTENIGFAYSPQPRISLRIKAGRLSTAVESLKRIWMGLAPGQDFEYVFLDDTIAKQYRAEQRTAGIVKIASLLSLLIACMGLFGLATLAVAKRTREIGIRKVLGASVSNVVGLVSGDFVKLVFLASVIAFPLAWWFLHDWLSDFAYRVDIGWLSFVLASVIAVGIALATVGVQALKAAMANPVRSLRSE